MEAKGNRTSQTEIRRTAMSRSSVISPPEMGSTRPRVGPALQPTAEHFRMLVENMKDYAIIILDTAGLVSSWNPGSEIILGYRSNEIIGQHFSRFYSAEDVERGRPQLELELA